MSGGQSDTRPRSLSLPDAARRDLQTIYRQIDEEIEATGVECWLRGRCCDFESSDHRLYASSVELAYVRELYPGRFPPGSVLCPFWKNGLCTERGRRPLGCRTYFCDERYRDQVEAIYEKYHQKIRQLADRHGLPYHYQPFVAVLRASPDCAPVCASDGTTGRMRK